jgi:Gpi18-like mannosyltransferase
MMKMEDMKRFSFPLQFSGIGLLFIIGIVFRGLALPAVSADMQWFLIPWYDFLKAHGPQGLGMSFSNYTPPYLYLLWLATLTSNYISGVASIKLISIFADIVNTVLVYRIVRLKYPIGSKPLLASALFWVLPTVMINSSLWGQADALYALFLLVCLYYLLTDKPLLGVIAFGVAITIKAQAIFIAPLLAILFFKKRIAWQYFLLVPFIYILLCLPAIILGKNWMDVFTIYVSQAFTYHELSRNAPNLYIFMNSFPYELGTAVALIITVVLIGSWIWLNVHAKSELRKNTILFMSLVSVALVPFLLPKMLDRYFYPADIFSLLAAFYMPALWFVPILYQIISTLAYTVFLFNAPPILTQIAAILNTLTIGFLIWKQVRTRIPKLSSQILTKESLS